MDLREYYERAFAENHGQIYGGADGWTAVQRSGHFRRMEILSGLDVGLLDRATAMDFGMGSWGFAAVYPRLREAAHCIGVDISEVATGMSRDRDAGQLRSAEYRVSAMDGVPAADGQLDIFWAGEVIEHVLEPRQFLQEAARACNDGAHVVLSTPNRDALHYLLDGQQYAIGPEHIALLNAPELQALAALFLDEVRLVGYETSLSPGVDRLPASDDVMRRVQERALHAPDLASGLVLHGRVSKSRFARNARSWVRRTVRWDDHAIAFSSPPAPLSIFGPEQAAPLDVGGAATCTLRGRKYVLFFWAHDWSGRARVRVGEAFRDVELFSRQGGFRRVEFEFEDSCERCVEIERAGTQEPRAMDSQVLFHSIAALDW